MEWAEARLHEPLGVESLARRAGYSIHHFSRFFSARTGEGPAEWIERRRMEQAQHLLLETSMKVLDVALACGYQEAATFTRAFRRQTGTTPSHFRAAKLAARTRTVPPVPPPHGNVRGSRIEELPAFRLCGLVGEVRGEAGAPGQLWTRLKDELPRHGLRPEELEFRQAAFWTEHAEERFTCLAGFLAAPGTVMPLPFVTAEIPAATCLVFSVPGPPEGIALAYQEIYGALLPAMTWRPALPCVFERYPSPGLTEIALPVSGVDPGGSPGSGIA